MKSDKTIEQKWTDATIQSMVKKIIYSDEDDYIPAVTDYDLIIVDEAHRGYILDKEIFEDKETFFENQHDYRSKYRREPLFSSSNFPLQVKQYTSASTKYLHKVWRKIEIK